MKIGISADFHLTNEIKNKERFNALRYILKTLKEKEIHKFIIVGDLFDKDFQNFKDFENLMDNFKDIEVLVIPGNHDENLRKNHIRNKNIQVIEKTTILNIGNIHFLFIPYINNSTIDEEIDKFSSQIGKNWILIGHGDYITSKININEYEAGIYMPLTRKGLQKYNPLYSFLGHIHKPISVDERVIYPGSPCSVDKSETGKRTFLIFDTDKGDIEREFVDTDIFYFKEEILIYPSENEFKQVRETLEETIKSWELGENQLKKVKLTLKLTGYSSKKSESIEYVDKILKEKGITILDEINSDELNISTSNVESRLRIFNEVKNRLVKNNFSGDLKREILKNAAKRIFEV